ncbi:MAG: ATP-dependent protease ATPase subunit HslU [Dehalococcoidia bacterium]
MNQLTPQAIVRELDRYIVGQKEAKRAVAIALRNRERRRKLSPEVRQEIAPKNILMIGPTGVGKTEIARRMAAIIDAPLIKVEATKFTEVGYVGRDVDSIISDLVEASVMNVYDNKVREVEARAENLATEKILDYLCKQLPPGGAPRTPARESGALTARRARIRKRASPSRKYMAQLLQSHQLDEQIIEIEVGSETEGMAMAAELPLRGSADEPGDGLGDFVDQLKDRGEYRRSRKVRVKEARRILAREEANKLIDFDQMVDESVERAEESGVIFIDELDKLAGPRVEVGRDVSGEGVQRDLLPIVEGTAVMTRFGPVKTDHMLFIAAGAFYQSRPSDLIPELQGRFPLRVEMEPLTREDMERILVEPQSALTKQYQSLLKTEGLELTFTPEGVRELARLACLMNERLENIGARRLHTIMEKVLEEINFSAPERKGEVVIDAEYISQQIGNLVQDEDLSRYIL